MCTVCKSFHVPPQKEENNLFPFITNIKLGHITRLMKQNCKSPLPLPNFSFQNDHRIFLHCYLYVAHRGWSIILSSGKNFDIYGAGPQLKIIVHTDEKDFVVSH